VNINHLNAAPIIQSTESPAALNESKVRANKIAEQSKELEKLFVTYLVKALEQTIPEGVFNNKQSNLTSMLFSSVMADAIVEQGGFGLSEMIAKSLNEKDAQVDHFKQPVLDIFDVLRTNLETRGEQ